MCVKKGADMEKRIVIVGAGYAGILTAKKLAKKFKKNNDVSITIIDKNPFHTMLTELHEVAANRVDEDSIKISLKKVFAGRRVNVKLDTVTSIDFERRTVIGENEKYSYDYLVLSQDQSLPFTEFPEQRNLPSSCGPMMMLSYYVSTFTKPSARHPVK
jgi:NADH dehydrogenase